MTSTAVIIICILVAVACAVAAVVLYTKNATLRSRLRSSEDQLRRSEEENAARLKEKDDLVEARLRERDEFNAARLKEKDEFNEKRLKEKDDLNEERLKERDRLIETRQSEWESALKKVDEQHQKDLEAMKEKFSVLATEIARKNTAEFTEQSTGKIQDILKPVGEKFEEFRKRVEEADKSTVEMRSSMAAQIKALLDQTDKVGGQARQLADALTNRSKVQGDFGEMILKDLLLNAGLQEGVHFQCQGVITDEQGREIKSVDGKTMIPDVLVFYPDGTAVVVDSKVSMTDYVTYYSTENPDEQAAAAKRHVASISKHIDELTDKDYASYIPDGKRKVDYNIMFIPNDGAFLLMLEKAPRLWQEARDRKVLIVSQMNLVVVLNMIQLVWKQSEREKNVDNIIAASSELMSQLKSWLDIYVKIGEKIKDLSKQYDDSTTKLTESNQSVVKKIKKLENLGAAPKQKSVGSAASRKAASDTIIPKALEPETPQDRPELI